MPRIISTGELRKMLRAHAELPETGAGVVYVRLPQTISRAVYDELDPAGQDYYVPDGESLFEVNGVPRYLSYVLPPGSYEAWWVKP